MTGIKFFCYTGMIIFILLAGNRISATERHTFALGNKDFLLDGSPFQIISGEMHPARIPVQYWRHRIQMAKAMGCNTIAAYIFWNYHETAPGVFDFSTDNHDLVQFIHIAQQEGLWVLFRPGPYVCAEWDFGGLPPYLLRIPDIKVRCMDPRYTAAVERYIDKLAQLIKPLLITNGGPILMVQIENEYGSYGNDKTYLEWLRKLWQDRNIDVPFYTADGATPYMLEAGHVDGAAIGLDPGADQMCFDEAAKHNPKVPAFSSETYPGWLTHWGESWARPDTADLFKEVRFLLQSKRSVNFYVIHGGTNFSWYAGANSGGQGYEPDITSYDYDAPINERGEATAKYHALRNLIGRHVGSLATIPDPTPVMEIAPIAMQAFSSLWSNLPQPLASVQPKPFEAYDQDYGFILYKTRLIGHKSGKLTITDLHDYATVFLNGCYVGKLDRRLGEKSIDLPKSGVAEPVLEILVEGMGRINYGQLLIDRKGITDRVTLNNMTLMNWQVYLLPMSANDITGLKQADMDTSRRGVFFKGSFQLEEPADTYFDMSGYQKGLVWVNGHLLGRYWSIGPQQRLYCPAPWLQRGNNEMVIFDLQQRNAVAVSGKKTLE